MKPIDFEFDVDCTAEHAFKMWTEKTSMWWPRSHTLSQDPDLIVHFEPQEGGRIYERASDGTEFEWGEVSVWDPPNRIEYLWHLFFDRSEATAVTVTFQPVQTGTRVRLVQTGFDRLNVDVGQIRRNRTEGAWAELTGHFAAAAAAERE